MPPLTLHKPPYTIHINAFSLFWRILCTINLRASHGSECSAHQRNVGSQTEFPDAVPESRFCLMVAHCKRCKFAESMLAALGRRLGPEWSLVAARFGTEFFIFAWFYKVFSYFRRKYEKCYPSRRFCVFAKICAAPY